jgi:hypothetical protein
MSAARREARMFTSTAPFDPKLWPEALTQIGGGYALMADRRLAFLVGQCDGAELTVVMSAIVGQQERQEAVKTAIERRQLGMAS